MYGNDPKRASRNSASPQRRLSKAIAAGETPHEAVLRTYPDATPCLAAEVPPADARTRHSLANHPGVRLCEPDVPDVDGAKYLAVKEGSIVRFMKPIVLREALQRLEVGSAVLAAGSLRPVVMRTKSGFIADFRGASAVEIEAIIAIAAEAAAEIKDEGPRMDYTLRIRMYRSLNARIRTAAEWERQLMNDPTARGHYTALWCIRVLERACERSEEARAQLLAATT